MVIEISPHSRDNFNDLATLTIMHAHGRVETPARIVNRYDLNAKTTIGADIPLMENSGVFMLQESIDPKKLESIMTKNGFLGSMLSANSPILERIDKQNLKLFYPSLTNECSKKVKEYSEIQKDNLVRFLCEVATGLGLESIVLPAIYDIGKLSVDVSRLGLQLIPSLDMRGETEEFKGQIQECTRVGCRDAPIIALEFARYASANQAYRHVMEQFDHIHDQSQAIMMVNAPRAIYAEGYLSVSAPHYGAFFTADLSVERYGGGGGGPLSRSVRLFSKDNLTTPKIDSDTSFDVDAEKTIFVDDPKLQEMLTRLANNTATDDDWRGGRPKALSRVHENLRSHPEFRNLNKSIASNSAREYLKEKSNMNKVVARELELEN